MIRLGLHASPELEQDRLAGLLASGFPRTVWNPEAAETDGTASADCPPGAGSVSGSSPLMFKGSRTEKVKRGVFAVDGL